MPIEVSDALLAGVRNYLDITWEDPGGDQKLRGIIARGIAYLNRIGGAPLDYAAEDLPRQLLFDYCRYVRSNALEQFGINFLPELNALQLGQVTKDEEQAAADLQ